MKKYQLKSSHSFKPTIDYAVHLNPEQLAAVTSGDGASLVIAGAGSGKTRVVTYRVAYLIEKGVDPSRILLLTFTNKASREMLNRVESLIEGLGRDIPSYRQYDSQEIRECHRPELEFYHSGQGGFQRSD
jgi:superfamily I DNA/RNA helicase